MATNYPTPGVYVLEVPSLARPIAGVGTSTPAFIGAIADVITLPLDGGKGVAKWIEIDLTKNGSVAGKPYFVSTWSQYTRLFGNFVGQATDTPATAANPAISVWQRRLAHAVFGFFENGGSGCYVVRVLPPAAGANATPDLTAALRAIAAIDEVTMVAAPGMATKEAYESLLVHCENLMGRVAILDAVETDPVAANGASKFDAGDFTALKASTADNGLRPRNSTYGAVYFPWITVADPAADLLGEAGGGLVSVPPSGHVAGVYARSDAQRGVFKAPANEVVSGAEGLRYGLSRTDQGELNGPGVNIIRPLIGAIRIWGARTIGGDDNGEFSYISTRRYFNYLRESIQQGTRFVVFEPNSPALWERIKRTVGDFLTREWRSGALFGVTADKAFYVKCDLDLNDDATRDAGIVMTEIGVAIVRPAEFVVFRIQQISGS